MLELIWIHFETSCDQFKMVRANDCAMSDLCISTRELGASCVRVVVMLRSTAPGSCQVRGGVARLGDLHGIDLECTTDSQVLHQLIIALSQAAGSG